MPKNDDGEFELVLGNRQLLSGFFIIVILFGIFFTMGYFVGRSSSPSSLAPIPTGGTAAAASSAPPLAPGQAEVVTSEPKRESAAPISTRTALGSGAAAAAEEPSVEPPAQKASSKAKPAAEAKTADPAPQTEKKKDSASKEAAAGKTSGDGEISLTRPKKGDMYLQVSAPLPAAAKGVVGALQRQGIDAIVAPGPVGKDTVRVLVGPLADSAVAGKMRAKLAEVGFKDTFVQKY
jgi:cell division protein FtsN